MATIARGRIPAEEFVLYSTLRELPDAVFETERIVKSGDDAVMPLLWVRGTDTEPFQEVCRDDPSVKDLTLLAEFQDVSLYRMYWVDGVKLLLQMLTNSGATILSAVTVEESWQLRVLYPDDIPRKTDQKELAEDLGISHQALSERLRRGCSALIEDTLIALQP